MLVFSPDSPVYVAAAQDEPVKAIEPFIQRSDLIEVLHDYFSGRLDEPDSPEIICQDLHEWHQNGLWCFTDSQQLNEIITYLPGHLRQVIFYSFVSCLAPIDELERFYVLRFSSEKYQVDRPTFDDYLCMALEDALQIISDALIFEL